MRRISLRSLMWYVSFIALGLAALRNADEFWASVLLLLTGSAFAVAILGIVHQKGRDRAWWIGFALFGAMYVVVFFGTWLAKADPSLGTTRLIDYIYKANPKFRGIEPSRLSELEQSYANIEAYLKDPKPKSPLDSPRAQIEATLDRLRDDLIEMNSTLTTGMELSRSRRTQLMVHRLFPEASSYGAVFQVGHCLFTLLAGLVGALISSRMYRERT